MRFFFNDAATTEIYTLSLRDALPISETVEEVTTMITQAGGTVNGAISLRPEYSDPSSASGLQSYVTGSGLPTGLQLPETDDAGQLVAGLIAQVLMVRPGGAAAPDGGAVSSVLAGLTALDALSQDSDTVTPADYAVVLTAGAFSGDDAADRNATVVELVSALDAAGSGAVVA